MLFNPIQKAAIYAQAFAAFERSSFYRIDASGKVTGQGKYAKTLGFIDADFSNLKAGKFDLFGDAKWIKLARAIGYQPNESLVWHTANTAVYLYVNTQLRMAQHNSATAMLCDDAGIGKTHAAKVYAANNTNVFYLDCSVTPGKAAFIRALGQATGAGKDGKLNEVLEASIYALTMMDKPLLILDEAGDMEHATLLTIKRLYNALEDTCGIYLIGADGLKSKIERGITYKKLGFVELYSRFGSKYSKLIDANIQKRVTTLCAMAQQIAEANGITNDAELLKVKNVITIDGGDMRRVKRLVLKLKNAN